MATASQASATTGAQAIEGATSITGISNITQSPVSKEAFESLQTAVKSLNQDCLPSKRGELIDAQTKFACLEEAARKELANRYPEAIDVKRKRDLLWKKIKHGLEKFCKVVYSYASVMDVLVASHPEIASLVWGAMKFLLTASINHQELKEKFTEHLAEIGEKFETLSSYVRTFPEEKTILGHVQEIYTIFLSVLKLSIDWCRENVFVKFVKSVAHPYSTRIRPMIEKMARHVQALTERVDAYNALHISHMPAAVLSLRGDIQTGLREVTQDTRSKLTDLEKAVLSLKTDMQISTDFSMNPNMVKVMQTASELDRPRAKYIFDSSPEFFQDEVSIKKKFFPGLLSAAEHIEQIRADCSQLPPARSYNAIDLLDQVEVSDWTHCQNSRLLWIDGFSYPHVSKWTTQFSMDVMTAVTKKGFTVLSFFGDLATQNHDSSLTRYLKSPLVVLHIFIAQLVQQHPSVKDRHPELFTRPNFESARKSMRTSWMVVKTLIESVPADLPLYVVVDSIDTIGDLSDDSRIFGSLIHKLSRLTLMERNRPIKVLLTSDTSSIVNPHFEESDECTALRIPHTFGRRMATPLQSHRSSIFLDGSLESNSWTVSEAECELS